jgi:hypothetical protein
MHQAPPVIHQAKEEATILPNLKSSILRGGIATPFMFYENYIAPYFKNN